MTAPALKSTWSQKLNTRVSSWKQYFKSVRADKRLAIYQLLPLITHPKSRIFFAFASSLFKPHSKKLSLTENTLRSLQKLRSDGVVENLPSIEPEHLSRIIEYFKSESCHDPYRLHLGQFKWDEVPSSDCNMAMYTSDQILRAPQVIKLFNSAHLLTWAEAYIGCKPTLDNIGCWWSYGGRVGPKGTQHFHRDFDSIGGFKVFFYLTEVDDQHGPHVYVRGSHKRQELDTGLAIPDELLWQHYDQTNEVVVTGNAGSSFIADTFGIHKGLLPIKGARLILSAQYNINVSPHGPVKPNSQIASDFEVDKYINRIYLKT